MAEEDKTPEAVQPEEDADFDYGTLDEDVTEELADYSAEETNPKEVSE